MSKTIDEFLEEAKSNPGWEWFERTEFFTELLAMARGYEDRLIANAISEEEISEELRKAREALGPQEDIEWRLRFVKKLQATWTEREYRLEQIIEERAERIAGIRLASLRNALAKLTAKKQEKAAHTSPRSEYTYEYREVINNTFWGASLPHRLTGFELHF